MKAQRDRIGRLDVDLAGEDVEVVGQGIFAGGPIEPRAGAAVAALRGDGDLVNVEKR